MNPTKVYSTTFITGYINLQDLESRPSTKNFNDYMKHCVPLLNSGHPFIVFCHDLYVEHLQKLVSNPLVKIVPVSISTMVYNTEAFFKAELPTYRNISKDTHWYLIVNSQKVHWLTQAIKSNPFQSSSFCWIDFGLNHIAKLDEKQYSDVLKKVSNEVQKTDKIICGSHDSIYGLDINSFNNQIVGGMLGGKPDNLVWLAQQQKDMIFKLISSKNKVTWETLIWQLIYHENKDRFTTYGMRYDASILRNFKA